MGLINILKKLEQIKNNTGSYEMQFLDEYNKALQIDERDNRQPVPLDYFRPSSMGGCKRMLFFMRKGAKGDSEFRDVELIGICDNGTDRHERIQRIVAKMDKVTIIDLEEQVKEARARGIDVEFMGWNSSRTEARCKNNDLDLFFQPDGLFSFLSKVCILEIKTISTYNFSKLVEPKKEHLIQGVCYAMSLAVDFILFFYEDRNFTTHKPFLIPVTEEMKQAVIDKVGDVTEYLKENVVPDKEVDKCTYCDYKKTCARYSKSGMLYDAEDETEAEVEEVY